MFRAIRWVFGLEDPDDWDDVRTPGRFAVDLVRIVLAPLLGLAAFAGVVIVLSFYLRG